jgi:hypothetical protein
VTPCFCFEARDDAFLDAAVALRLFAAQVMREISRDPIDNGQTSISPSQGAKSKKIREFCLMGTIRSE